jgi:hypothetical protein
MNCLKIILVAVIFILIPYSVKCEEYSILGFSLNDTLDDIIKKGTEHYTIIMPNGLDGSRKYVASKAGNNFILGSFSASSLAWPEFFSSEKGEKRERAIPSNSECKVLINNINKYKYFTNQIRIGLINLEFCDKKNTKDKTIDFYFTRDVQVRLSDTNGKVNIQTKIDYNSDNIKLIGIIVYGEVAKYAEETLTKRYGDPNNDPAGKFWYNSGKLLHFEKGYISNKIYLWDLSSYEGWLGSFMPVINDYFSKSDAQKKKDEENLKNQL